MPHDDGVRDWVEAARRGDEQGFIRIYRAYAKKVRGLLGQMLGTEGLDDQVQEVFLRVWKGLGSPREVGAFSGWIYRTTWNVDMDFRRSAAQQRTHEDELARNDLNSEKVHQPERAMDAKILVERALGALDFDHLGVIVLVDLEDLSLESAAQIMDIPVGTVKSRLFKARERLRNYFEAEGVAL
ncbi:MAG: hypothetical protein RI932_602 [Pseudomonadota bacterium]